MKVIFLAGVHGVGKGYLGSPVARKLGIHHLTASQLIRDERGHATWSNDKRVGEVDVNQRALIAAVGRFRINGEPLLLDGHFVLRDLDGALNKLPIEVFEQLQLAGVILLSDDAELIAKRLLSRDQHQGKSDAVAGLAVEESCHARAVCSALALPLAHLYKANEQELLGAVEAMLRGAALG